MYWSKGMTGKSIEVNCNYYLSYPVCALEFSGLRIRQGACTGQPGSIIYQAVHVEIEKYHKLIFLLVY